MRKIQRIKPEDWGKTIRQLQAEIAVKEVKIIKEKQQVQSTYKDGILTPLQNRKDGLERVLKTKEIGKKESDGMTNDLFQGGGSGCAT